MSLQRNPHFLRAPPAISGHHAPRGSPPRRSLLQRCEHGVRTVAVDLNAQDVGVARLVLDYEAAVGVCVDGVRGREEVGRGGVGGQQVVGDRVDPGF